MPGMIDLRRFRWRLALLWAGILGSCLTFWWLLIRALWGAFSD